VGKQQQQQQQLWDAAIAAAVNVHQMTGGLFGLQQQGRHFCSAGGTGKK
jgi:hypothetical protein